MAFPEKEVCTDVVFFLPKVSQHTAEGNGVIPLIPRVPPGSRGSPESQAAAGASLEVPRTGTALTCGPTLPEHIPGPHLRRLQSNDPACGSGPGQVSGPEC